jgi:hypothetical protein
MQRPLHRALLRCTTLVILSMTASAHAQPAEPIELQWNAAEGCPSKAEVSARIRTLSVTWPPRGAPLRAAATIVRLHDSRFQMTLTVRAGGLVGERRLEATTCASLANAAAVHIALLLNDEDPQRAASRFGAEGSTAESAGATGSAQEGTARSSTQASAAATAATNAPENATQNAPEDATAPANSDGSPLRLQFVFQAPRASVQLGPLPRPSFGVSIAAGLALENWRILAAAHVWLAQALRSEDQPEVRADVDRISASLRVCRAAARSRFELAPCAKLSLEHVWARGAGTDVTRRTAEATWVAAGVGLQSRLYLFAFWYLVADLDAELETARPEISIDGLGRLGKLSLAAFSLTLGSEWIL